MLVVLAALVVDERPAQCATPLVAPPSEGPPSETPLWAAEEGRPRDGLEGADKAGAPSASAVAGSARVLDTMSTQLGLLRGAISRREIWQPALFVFLFLCTPTADSAFLYFLTDDIGLSQEFLGRVSLGGSLASIAGITVYQRFLREVPVQRLLLGTTLACLPFGLAQLLLVTHANRQLGLPDGLFAFGDDVVLSVLGEFAHMPTLVLAARLCPPGVEGALFASLMSMYNLAGTVGAETGAALTAALGVGVDGHYERLWLLVLLCNLASLLPLPFLGLLSGIEDPHTIVVRDADSRRQVDEKQTPSAISGSGPSL